MLGVQAVGKDLVLATDGCRIVGNVMREAGDFLPVIGNATDLWHGATLLGSTYAGSLYSD